MTFSADIDTIKRNFYKLSAVMLLFVIIILTGAYFMQLPAVRASVDESKRELAANAEAAMRHEIQALSNAIETYLDGYEDAVDTFMYNGAIAYQEYERQYNPTREQGDRFAQKARITEFEVFKPDGNLLYATGEDVAEDSLNLYDIWDGYRAIVSGEAEEIKSTIKIRVETGQIFKFTAVPRLDKGGNITGIIESCLNVEGLETQIADFLSNYSQVRSMHLFSLSDGFTLVSVENSGANIKIPRGRYYDIAALSPALSTDGTLYTSANGRTVYSSRIARTGVGDSYLLQLEFDESYYTATTGDVREQIDGIFHKLNTLSLGSMALCVLTVVALIVVYIINMNRVVLRSMEQLSNQTRLAEQANSAKSRFLATMSHEIRTPMNAILGIAQIQLYKANLSGEQEVALEKIYHSGRTLLGIINDILDMSKIETGKMELHPVEYSAASLINDASQLNVVRIGSKPIEFILDIDHNLPSKMYGDELRLKQILNNLLSNAIKYTEKGSVKLSVNHEVMGHEGDCIQLRFMVEDTGQGMKPADREKLFTEYLRFNDEANRATEGTGLGLSITKQLVAMMGGGIEVASEYGKGSSFTVTVMQKSVPCEALGSELAEQLRNFTFSGGRRSKGLAVFREPMPYGHVLVVDDVETNLYVAEGLLCAYGLRIETAVSGFAAIEKVESGAVYDVIFMDHMMPLMDGVETTRKLRAMGYGGVIIALTANALSGTDEMFRQQGFDGFIAKPIDVHFLNTILNEFVRDRHPEEAARYAAADTGSRHGAVAIDPRLLTAFCNDAASAVASLREAALCGDIKRVTITAHGMKSALANIGEEAASASADALESAGRRNDTAFISDNTKDFIQRLETLLVKYRPPDADGAPDANRGGNSASGEAYEDTACLTEQLLLIKAACDAYDDTAAYAALDRLQALGWKTETAAALKRMRDMLFLHSDFEGVSAYITTFMPQAAAVSRAEYAKA